MKIKLTIVLLLVLAGRTILLANPIFVTGLATNYICQTNELSSLKIIVTPRKTRVHVGEPFKVALEVKNISNANQQFRVWGCSWYENWKSSNPVIGIKAWDCIQNGVGTIKLAPGESFKETLDGKEADMEIFQSVSTNKISFRMAFHTGGSVHLYKAGEVIPDEVKGKIYWSDEVTININPKSVPDWISW